MTDRGKVIADAIDKLASVMNTTSYAILSALICAADVAEKIRHSPKYYGLLTTKEWVRYRKTLLKEMK